MSTSSTMDDLTLESFTEALESVKVRSIRELEPRVSLWPQPYPDWKIESAHTVRQWRKEMERRRKVTRLKARKPPVPTAEELLAWLLNNRKVTTDMVDPATGTLVVRGVRLEPSFDDGCRAVVRIAQVGEVVVAAPDRVPLPRRKRRK